MPPPLIDNDTISTAVAVTHGTVRGLRRERDRRMVRAWHVTIGSRFILITAPWYQTSGLSGRHRYTRTFDPATLDIPNIWFIANDRIAFRSRRADGHAKYWPRCQTIGLSRLCTFMCSFCFSITSSLVYLLQECSFNLMR